MADAHINSLSSGICPSILSIVTNHNGPLKAVDCDIHSVGYDIVLECCSRPSQIGPHQVTYDAVAWLMHISTASVVAYILLSYRNQS
eukprot:scaffold4172_cov87-Skeletonema_dohrnii-CCMP3373.AAC.1